MTQTERQMPEDKTNLKDNESIAQTGAATLSRRLGLFDATMIVMGGIIGSGIFMNPYVVAQQVHTPFLILFAWAFGGLVALAGAFIYAELAERRPETGGQYAYLREAFHPSVAFVFGWSLLLVVQTGGMAAVAVTFARYFIELTGTNLSDWLIAVVALAVLTIVNCFGVRAGSTVQNILMILKIGAIVLLVVCGFVLSSPANSSAANLLDHPVSFDLLTAMGAALIPVMFAYGGWQTSCFVAGELRAPQRDLPRGLLIGVLGVIALYLSVNVVCLYVLGAEGLMQTKTPASEVMRIVLGETGAKIIAIGITISTLGFLSQGMLTAPRVYFAMADDRLFFRQIAWLHPKTFVPVAAIVLQGVWAMVIAASGRYEQILNYVVSVDFIFFGLTAACVFIFRRRDQKETKFKIPLHPLTTIFFIAACVAVVAATVYKYPENSLIGLAIMLIGIPIYFLWKRQK